MTYDRVYITCSCCGNSQTIGYTATDVNKTVKDGWNSFGDALYCPDCVKTWEERNGKNKPLWGKIHTIKKIDDLHDRTTPKTVTEYCSCCDSEIEMCWDVERDGFKAFCPVCGNRLMLCDECKHRSSEFIDDCDYDGVSDSCKFNPKEENGK